MARGAKSEYTDVMGRFLTRSLFVETILKEQLDKGMKPKYSLTGLPGYINAHKMYLDSNDPTGYIFAIQLVDSWKHFQYLTTIKWFAEYLSDWYDELEVKIRSEGIRSLMDTAKTEGSRGVSAAKYIADAGWRTKRGRPSKEEVEREKKAAARMKEELGDDAARMNLH